MATLVLVYIKGHNNEQSKKDDEKELTPFKLVMVLSMFKSQISERVISVLRETDLRGFQPGLTKTSL